MSPSAVISVIIPAWNAAHCIGQCLAGVRAQTRAPAEVIVVDDGSSDETAATVRRLHGSASVVAIEHGGAAAARNAGVAASAGDYVAFLDADDTWMPQFIEATAGFLDRHPDVVAVSTGGRVRSVGGVERNVPDASAVDAVPRDGTVLDDFFAFWAGHDHLRTGMVLVRRSAFDAVGGQREDLRISQDLEFWALLGTLGPIGFIPRRLWVGNSQLHRGRTGWLAAYAERRRLCPSVEQWQERVVPRLQPAQSAPFAVVRGRVAAGFAHSLILANRDTDALACVRTWGAGLPVSWLTRLLRIGGAHPSLWRFVCALVRARERRKARRLQALAGAEGGG